MPFQVNKSGNPDINGVLWGYSWDFLNLTWGVPNSTAPYVGYDAFDIVGFQSLNTLQYRKLIAGIIKQLDSVCGLTFTFQNDAAVANIRYAKAQKIDIGDGSGLHTPGDPLDRGPGSAEAVPPDDSRFPLYAQGDLWFSYQVTTPPPIGSFKYTAWLIHEAGHGLGLKHGHQPLTSHGVNFPTLPFDHDSQEYSVMTYKRYVGDPLTGGNNLQSDYPTTLMQADIAALQWMYGADYTTNGGNTTYRWNGVSGELFINGQGQGAHYHRKVFLTVWDGGGVDTYDMSNYGNGVKIDLNPGAWSTTAQRQLADLAAETPGVHLARGNIANAQVDPNNPNEVASLIENAIGGAGNDSILGNVVANLLNAGGGRDTLFGEAGQDTINGMGGDDFIQGGFDVDVLNGGAGRDTVDYSYSNENWTLNLNGGRAIPASGGTETIRNFEALVGGSGRDSIVGTAGANQLFGGAGIDTLTGGPGKDTLVGEAGGDTITGGKGADRLTGGVLGPDRFDFNSADETPVGIANRDTVSDFSHAQKDRIDLTDIDANALIVGDQDFTFRGKNGFTGPGQVNYLVQGGGAIVAGNTDGDLAAEFHIFLANVTSLVAGDFIL